MKKDKNKLPRVLVTYRSLLVLALTKIENKNEYLEKILSIKNIDEWEKELWDKVKKNLDVTGDFTKADIINIFGWRKIDNDTINKLIGSDVEDEFETYLSQYEKIMRITSLYYLLYEYREKLRCLEPINIQAFTNEMYECLNVNTREVTNNIIDKFETMYNEDLNKEKISTCINEVDELINGFRKGTINSVMGYTGSYKTLYCINVAYEAIRNGFNVCYISLEISSYDIYSNFLSRYSNEDIFDKKLVHSDIIHKELNNDDNKYLFDTIVPSFKQDLSKHLRVCDETNFNFNSTSSFDNLFSKIDKEFISNTSKGIDLVIIDHLNLLKYVDSNDMNDYSRVNHWMSYFRKNCKNFINRHRQICILAAVQCSRDAYEKARRNGGSYLLTGAADGSEIERSSENALAIYTDSSLKDKLQAKIQVLKGRNRGEMLNPITISVDPRYYIISRCDETITKELDKKIIDVTKL